MQRSTTYRPPLPRRPQPAGNPGAAPGRCPCVGALADPGTALAFPSDSNHCFRTNFPIPISSIHQENYCLTAQYVMCPVFQQYAAEPGKAPAALTPAAPAPVTAGVAQPVGADDDLLAGAVFGGAEFALGVGAARSVPTPAPALVSSPAPARERDFAPYDPSQESDPAPRRSLRVDKRIVLLGLALLALLALAGGARLKLFGGRAGVEDGRQGAVVVMPTLAPTADLSALAADLAAQATPTVAIPTAAVEPAGDGVATDAPGAAATTSTELDSIAATATAMFAGAAAPVECAPVGWWVSYVVVEGDTVESLAASRGITPEELIVGNCLGPQPLVAGQSLFLPPVGVIIALLGQPTATLNPTAQPTATRAPGLPTRPALFPTPTPIVIIVATARGITPEAPATDEPPPRPSRAPSTVVPPPPATATPRSTATPAAPPSTATPPRPTATPAVPLTPTVRPTATPASP